jgi:hypothetical protein
MEYNWSWLPPQRVTTPPPTRPSPEELDDVEVFEESNGGYDQARRRHFMRSFSHDNQENEGVDPYLLTDLNGSDIMTDFDEETGGSNTDEDDIDNDGMENGDGEDADVTGDEDVEEGEEGDGQEDEVPFDPASVGLKEISNLASFTVSSYKPGCGVKELRDDDVNLFWQ